MMFYWLKLRKIRVREQKKLNRVNIKMFKKIIEYIKNSNLQYIEKEEALHQIMDILLQAQAEYKSADVIIGDYEEFCKSIIQEYTKDKSTVYTVLHHVQRAFMSMLSFLVAAIIFNKVLFLKMDTGINAYLLIFAMGMAFILQPFSHNSKQKKWASIIYFIVTMSAISYLTMTQWGTIIDKMLINNTNVILIGAAVVILVIEVYKRLFDRKRHFNDKC